MNAPLIPEQPCVKRRRKAAHVARPRMSQDPDLRNGVWVTPWEFFCPLQKEFGLNIDVAASADNSKCERFYDEKADGLKQDWTGERVWCNPPYGRKFIYQWIKKCATSNAAVVVALLPARTDTRWFHDFVLGKAEIRWIKGRIKFSGMKGAGKFPALVAIWKGQP